MQQPQNSSKVWENVLKKNTKQITKARARGRRGRSLAPGEAERMTAPATPSSTTSTTLQCAQRCRRSGQFRLGKILGIFRTPGVTVTMR